jgi:hypothetical protein
VKTASLQTTQSVALMALMGHAALKAVNLLPLPHSACCLGKKVATVGLASVFKLTTAQSPYILISRFEVMCATSTFQTRARLIAMVPTERAKIFGGIQASLGGI